MTISSPFGMLSSELYRNCLRSGSISKIFALGIIPLYIEDDQVQEKFLLLLDLITNLGQEGGGVYD